MSLQNNQHAPAPTHEMIVKARDAILREFNDLDAAVKVLIAAGLLKQDEIDAALSIVRIRN